MQSHPPHHVIGRWGLILALVAILPLAVGARPANAQSRKQRLQQAKKHYKSGKAAFELGRFQKALGSYEEAYRIAALPGLLFNIGQCYRNLGELEKASFSFKLYLRKLPNARNRVAVQRLLAELDQQLVAQQEQQRQEKELRAQQEQEQREREQRERDAALQRKMLEHPPQAPLPPKPIYQKWWFWTLIGVAASGAAAGIYFGTQGGNDLPSSPFPTLEVSR
ncbi:MAG: hypothetical protein JRH20_11480 [Deltaproteobacteria bacterium]|nr:hypothetical protein [Deltaproteobacteria bacterium]